MTEENQTKKQEDPKNLKLLKNLLEQDQQGVRIEEPKNLVIGKIEGTKPR